MDQQQWKKINNIVDTALDLNKSERATYIKEECKGDEQLKRQVTELLDSIEQSETENFLEDLEDYPLNLAREISETEIEENTSSLIGTTIDSYKIIELIGHGGMGSVFLAERSDEAYTQKVALKLMRKGMDTPSNIARFKRERKILAKLDHPNIARLLDGGITESGLPYLVMEYVEGIPLHTYCKRQRFSIKKRLSLFNELIIAVQHAHNNAIIHRDLKPSNILVTDEGNVKVLDFGIAKIVESDPKPNHFTTQTGNRILTLGYAAPEQLKSEPITTSTDSYVLGILLYELLTGVSPHEFEQKGVAEIEDAIRTKTPVKPSERVANLSSTEKNEIAESRNCTPKALKRQLRGDLDAIVMKALRKEPSQRYSSAEQLLQDMNRRRTDLPIIAREDTFRYNASKFLKRHKTGLSVAVTFLLVIIGFTALYTFQIAQERNKAQLEAQKAQEVSNFLTDMFRASNPNYNPRDTVTAATFLKRGEKRINQLENQPEVQAQLLEVMGRAYTEIGQFNKANPLLQRSFQLRKTYPGNTSTEYSQSLDALVVFHRLKGNFAKAESLTRKSISIIKTYHPNNKKLISNGLNELGLILDQRGKYEEADSVYKAVLHIQQQIYESNHPKIAHTHNNRAGVLRKLGNFEKAEELYRRALTIWKKKNGDIHPNTAMGYHDLALILNQQGKLEKADSLYHKGLKIDKQLYDPPNRHIAQSYNNIGTFYGKQGRYQESKPYLIKAVAMRRKLFSEFHPKLAESLNNLGRLFIELENYEKAHPYLKEALKIDRKNFGDKHPYVAGDLANLARIEKENGSLRLAEKHLRKSLSTFRATLPSDHRKIADILTELGDLLILQDNLTEAISLLQEALKIKNNSYDERSWQVAYSKSILGKALTKSAEFQKAESYLTQAYETLKEERGATDNFTKQARKNIIQLYHAWDKPKMAKKYILES